MHAFFIVPDRQPTTFHPTIKHETMTLNLRESLNFILKPALLLAGCLCMARSSGDKHVDDPDGPDNPGGGDEYEDIQVVNGKVRFYLREAENSVRKAMGTGERAWSKSLVSVNGKSYAVESDENGRYYVEASASSSGTYNAILTNSGSSGWYGSSAYADVKLPYSQFWAATAASLQSYPMYGSYTKENGNKLVFDDAFAVLDLALTGSAKIASVKVENLAESPLAGYANFLPSRGYLSITGGVGFAVLNCTDNGKCVSLESGTPKHFYVMLAPGDYPSGLKITISDSEHRAMEHNADDCAADGGEGHVRNAEIRPRRRPGVLREFRQFRLGRQHHGRPGVDGIRPDGRSRHPRYGNRTRRLCELLREGRLQQPRLGVHPVEHVGRDQRQNGRHVPPDVRFVRREPQYRRLYLYVPLPGIPGLSGLRHR